MHVRINSAEGGHIMHKNRQFMKSLKQVRVGQMILSVTLPVLKGRGRQGCAGVGRGVQG